MPATVMYEAAGEVRPSMTSVAKEAARWVVGITPGRVTPFVLEISK